jgi:hypothetical protein
MKLLRKILFKNTYRCRPQERFGLYELADASEFFFYLRDLGLLAFAAMPSNNSPVLIATEIVEKCDTVLDGGDGLKSIDGKLGEFLTA